MQKLVIGIATAIAAGVVALGIGIDLAHQGPTPPAKTAESRPVQNGEMPAPPAPKQLVPSARVVVNGK